MESGLLSEPRPNMRVQRTRSASLRSPLTRHPLGARSLHAATRGSVSALVLVLAAALVSAASNPTDLVGLWESTTTSRGGIGHTFEFRSDGTFVEATTVIVDGYYRLVGNRLVNGEQPVGLGADVSKAARIKFDGDVLEETGPDGSVVRKERMGTGTESSPLVGAWRYRHYTDVVAFERYTADGRMFFRLPMVSSVGRYSLKGNELLIVGASQRDATMTTTLHGDTLSLVTEGKTTNYRRVSAGPWYEREHIVRYTPK
jgi:hypothetical protein